jgi:hypothetical protein
MIVHLLCYCKVCGNRISGVLKQFYDEVIVG